MFAAKFLAIALTTLVFSNAFAADETPAPGTTAPVASPGVSAPPICSREFVLAYVSTMREVQTLFTYLKAKERPPNFEEAYMACTRLNTEFAGVTCTIPTSGETPSTADFAQPCEAISKAVKSGGVIPNPAQGVNDSTPLYALKASSLRIGIGNAGLLSSMLARPRAAFAVRGSVYDLIQTTEIDAPVRCALDLEINGVVPALTDGTVYNGAVMLEEPLAGVRVTQIGLMNAGFGIICVNESGKGLTLGALKQAFGPMLSITYMP